jgi:hypothetical protein
MENIRPIVFKALASDLNLLALLGGENIYYMIAPKSAELPRITYYEYLNIDNSFAEDMPTGSNIGFQIDIWSDGDTSSLSLAVDNVMKGIGFNRTYAIEEYDEEVRLFRYVMRYTTQVEL